jgi:hypothetical protein
MAIAFKTITNINMNNPNANNKACSAGPPPSANIFAEINAPNERKLEVIIDQKPLEKS